MVKIFDHHYVVESPGILPGMVRVDNIRQMHFSRNPKIVQFMQQYKLVKEFGEGVDRMFREMAEAGNPAPEYKQVEFMVKVKLTSALREENVKKDIEGTDNVLENVPGNSTQLSERQRSIIKRLEDTGKRNVLGNVLENAIESSVSLANFFGVNERTIRRDLQILQREGFIRHVGPDKGGHWEVIEQEDNKQ